MIQNGKLLLQPIELCGHFKLIGPSVVMRPQSPGEQILLSLQFRGVLSHVSLGPDQKEDSYLLISAKRHNQGVH